MSYTSTIEEVNSTRRKFRVNVDKSVVAASINKALLDVQKTAQLKGFRKGKVPAQLVRKFFIQDVRQKALEDVFQQTYPKVSEESQLQIVSSPKVDVVGAFEDGQDFVYEATVDVNPQVEIQGYKGLKLSIEKSKLPDLEDQIKQTRERFLRNAARFEEVAGRDTVQKDDYVTMDYRILDGETPLKGQARKGARMLLDGSNLPEVESGLVGAVVSKTALLPVTFPESHPDAALRGKSLNFEVTVRAIETLKLPDVDEEFVKKFGFGSPEDFEKSLRETVGNAIAKQRAEILRVEILKQVVPANPFEVPESLIDNTIDRAIAETNARLAKSEQLKSDDPAVRARFKDKALEDVRAVLALGHIARMEQLKVDEAAVAKEISQFAMENGMAPEQIIRQYGRQAIDEFRGKVLIDKVVDMIIEQATVEEV
jgi:trigger factor